MPMPRASGSQMPMPRASGSRRRGLRASTNESVGSGSSGSSDQLPFQSSLGGMSMLPRSGAEVRIPRLAALARDDSRSRRSLGMTVGRGARSGRQSAMQFSASSLFPPRSPRQSVAVHGTALKTTRPRSLDRSRVVRRATSASWLELTSGRGSSSGTACCPGRSARRRRRAARPRPASRRRDRCPCRARRRPTAAARPRRRSWPYPS
jgi:hypothetical protein